MAPLSQLQLACASLNQTPLDWDGNRDRILTALRRFARDPVVPDVVLFPELCVTGYGCEDAFHSPDVTRRALRMTMDIAREARRILPDTLVIVGLPVRYQDRIYNCAGVLLDGRLDVLIAKQKLPGDGVHYEPRWFTEFRRDRTRMVDLPDEDRQVPLGAPLLEFRGLRIAVEICEDAWVPDRPALYLGEPGIDLILNPSASHFAFGKQALRRGIVRESSRAFATVFAQVNLLGNESGRMIYDGGAMIAANGQLLLETPRFSFRDMILCRVAIDVEVNRVVRGRLYSHKLENLDYPADLHRLDAGPPGEIEAEPPDESLDDLDVHTETTAPVTTKFGEFYGAVTLGLFDYLRKSRSKGIVISLSGGADSGACAVLVQRMIARAVEELGPTAVLERLGLEHAREDLEKVIRGGKPTTVYFVRFFTHRILHTIYQGTSQSSDVTRDAARALARELQSDHHEVDVQAMMDGYRQLTEQILKRELTWERDDLALQNIQARARSPMAWMLANTTNSLLIVTSNRSEAAVGYCTMDGDTSGGLAPIAGVDKAFLREWLVHMERTGEEPGGPLPVLSHINSQAPTAELRPLEAKQTDEADLMPYEILDRIERLAIRDRKSPREVFEAMGGAADGPDEATLKNYIRRFFSLWHRNQWKRERYAPGFHLDDENLDPRTWYRFPILSGGYAVELRELDESDR